MNWNDYNSLLGIVYTDNDLFEILKNKIKNLITYLSSPKFDNAYKNPSFIDYFIETGYYSTNQNIIGVLESIDCTTTLNELVNRYVAFSNTAAKHINNHILITLIKDFLPNQLSELNIQYEIINEGKAYYIIPRGVKQFDEALVSDVSDWLQHYPASQKAWKKALTGYYTQSNETASDVADSFRKSIETFFMEFFEENKSLENMRSTYGNYLKEHNVPKDISNNFESILKSYTNFINNNAKHHDKTDRNILEYIMYETGNIIRLLITLKRNDKQ